MDNLTHSLAGALIGQTGLKRKTGLGMAALIIGANIPDIDAACFLWLQEHEHLAFRRGITHGPIAMAVLPVVLTGLLLLYDRWRPNLKRIPVHAGWLYALALIGTLSHPAMDWLNNYGIRLLEPFSSQWFYGDSIFIIDVWMWAAMITGLVWSMRREKAGQLRWQRSGQISVATVCAYIFVNGLITGHAEAVAQVAVPKNIHVDGDLISLGIGGSPPGKAVTPELVVANAVPLAFWRREIVWRGEGYYGNGEYSLISGVTIDGLGNTGFPNAAVDAGRKSNPAVRAFLFWSRMPVLSDENGKLILSDQRFGNPLTRSRFTVEVPR